MWVVGDQCSPRFAIHSTVVCNSLLRLDYAWVWGRSAKHQPQRCGKEHRLMDEDIVQLVKKSGGG
jgi:ribosome-interacting GTPase 1